jgi:hypothetical protein
MTIVVLPELLGLHEPLSFLAVNITILSIIAGTAAIVFGLFRRFHPKFMKAWSVISLILGTYISFSFFVGKIRDPIGLLLFFTAETVAIFGAGVIISVLSDLLHLAIKPFKASMPTANGMRTSIRQYKVMALLATASFLLFIFVNILFLPVIPPMELPLPFPSEYVVFLYPFCPFSYAKQIGVYPGLAIIGILFGLFLVSFLSCVDLLYHMEEGKPKILTRKGVILDTIFFCFLSAGSLVLKHFLKEINLHEKALDLEIVCIFIFLCYIIKRFSSLFGASACIATCAENTRDDTFYVAISIYWSVKAG